VRQFLSVRLSRWQRSLGGLTLALCDGEQIIGVVVCEGRGYRPSQDKPNTVLIRMEFVVGTEDSQETRLAKLLVMALKGKEFRFAAERHFKIKVTKIQTTAFSLHPDSSKYRGVMTLRSRTELPDKTFKLVYVADVTDETFEEILPKWRKMRGGSAAVGTAGFQPEGAGS
jgi:hypothetical protein